MNRPAGPLTPDIAASHSGPSLGKSSPSQGFPKPMPQHSPVGRRRSKPSRERTGVVLLIMLMMILSASLIGVL